MKRVRPMAVLACALLWLGFSAAAQTPAPPPHAPGPRSVEVITLEQAFQMALDSNEEAKLADLKVKQNALLPWRAVSIVSPNVNASATRMYPKEELKTGEPGSETIIMADPTDQLGISLVQPLFNAQAYATYRGSKYLVNAAKDERVSALQNLLFRVADTYFNHLKVQRLVEVGRGNLRLAEEHFVTASNRYAAGEVAKTDVLRAEVMQSRAQRELESALNSLQLSRTALSLLIGITNRPFEVKEPSDIQQVSFDRKEALDELVRTAWDTRSDLSQLTNQLRVAQWNLKRTRYSLLPTLDVAVEQQWVRPESSSQPSDFWTATIRANLPLFEGGSRKLDIKEARYGLEQAELGYSQLRKAIQLQVTDAWLQSKTAKVNLQAVEKELELAQENYDVMSKRYQAGQATNLDMIDAMNQLALAKISVANQLYDYQVAVLRLLRQIGLFGERQIPDWNKGGDA